MAFPASAAEVEVRDVTALVEAVKNANEGDVIKVYPGDYNIPQDDVTTVQGQTGWYLPIEASGITIVGVDENGNEITDAANAAANLYSTDYSANGSWPTQNLITVFGDNVTMKGLVIMNKIDANKSIEVYADGFTIENCTFAPIAERMLEGRNPEDLGGYVYDEYKEYGASLYFNAHANAVVKNNIFQNSNLTLSEDLTGTMEITGNTFSGVKNWKNDPEFTYSAIGYTSWAKPPVTDISGADITIEENKFENAGTINFSKVETGSVDVSNNYWGGEAPAEDKLKGPVTVKNYYTDEAMTEKAWTDEATKTATPETIAEILTNAQDGDLIILGVGEYTEDITLDKAVTLTMAESARMTSGIITVAKAGVVLDKVNFEYQGYDTPYGNLIIRADNVTVKDSTFVAEYENNPENGRDRITGNEFGLVQVNGNKEVVFENCTFKTNVMGIFPTQTSGSITGCSFLPLDGENARRAVAINNCGQDMSEVSIVNNTFEGRRILTSTAIKEVSGNKFLNFDGSAFVSEFLADGVIIDVSENYWGSETPDLDTLLGATSGQFVASSYYKTLDETTGELSDLILLSDETEIVDGEVVFVQNGTNVDIYLEGRLDGQPALIEKFVALEMTVDLNVTEGNLAIESIAPGENMVVVPQGDSTYLIRKAESNDVVITSDSIHLGTLTLGGFGKGTIGLDSEKPAKMEREINDSIAVTGTITATDTPVSFEEEKVTLTINVAFNNNITAGNTADYNDFTITVKDAKGEEIVYKLGKSTNEGEFAVHYVDDYTAENAKIEVDVTKGYRYSIEAQGAGYRTYRTSVLADGDKTVNLWNNVKDAEAEVTTGVSATKNFLAGDIVMDNVINLYDLSAVVSYFGQEGIDVEAASNYAQYDLNRDGKIDSKDVAMVLVSWEE